MTRIEIIAYDTQQFGGAGPIFSNFCENQIAQNVDSNSIINVRNQKESSMGNGFTISTDKNKLDVAAIHDYLCNRSYWGHGRTIETVRKSIDNSLCFGMYDKDANLVGFARVVTDYTVFAYLMDLFILEAYRNQGLGKMLVDHIVNEDAFKDISLWRLDTKDAHELYRKYAFQEPVRPERIMERRKVASLSF